MNNIYSKAIISKPEGVHIKIYARPSAKKTEIDGLHGEDRIKIRIHAPPVDGKANEELLRFLAELFDCSLSRVTLVTGEKSKLKTISISGVLLNQALQKVK